MLGILKDRKNRMTLNFKNEGDSIYLIGSSKNDIASSEYLYATQSEGPPKEVTDFVRATVRETEGWYQQQLRMVEKSGP